MPGQVAPAFSFAPEVGEAYLWHEVDWPQFGLRGWYCAIALHQDWESYSMIRASKFLGLALSGVAMVSLAPVAVHAQQASTVQAPPSVRPVPDQLEMSKLIWSTILAVDHANRSGNYSVLRDLGAQGFQINNNAAQLAQVFAGIRERRIDLSNALLVPPTYSEAPRQVQEDIFEVKGIFQLRPTSIYFDIFYRWEQGRWKLFGIDIQPLDMVDSMPGPSQVQQQTPQEEPRRRRRGR